MKKAITSEQEMSLRLRRLMEDAGVHVDQIECKTSAPGMFDLDGCYEGHMFKLELKYTTNDKKAEIRATQKRWCKDRITAGGAAWCLLLHNGTDGPIWILISGNEFAYLPCMASFADFVRGPHMWLNWPDWNINIADLLTIIASD